jgi:hypothetical protein
MPATRYSPYRDASIVLCVIFLACFLYWRANPMTESVTVVGAARQAIVSVGAIGGGPITGWLMIVQAELYVRDRLPVTDPRRERPLAGLVANSVVTLLAFLAWVPYLRDRCRGALMLGLGIWLATGWFYAFAIWA